MCTVIARGQFTRNPLSPLTANPALEGEPQGPTRRTPFANLVELVAASLLSELKANGLGFAFGRSSHRWQDSSS